MASLKYKQELCGFPEDKNANRRKVSIREFHEKLFEKNPRKDKIDPNPEPNLALLPSSVPLLSAGTVQSENTYSYILKVVG